MADKPDVKNNTLIKTGILLCIVIIAGGLWANNDSDVSESKQQVISNTSESISHSLVIPSGQDYIIKTEPADGIVTNQNEVSIKGRISDFKATVTINDRLIQANREGYFSETLYLNPGKNLYTFVFENAAKGFRKEQVLSWNLDKTPPFFQLDNLSPDQSLVLIEKPVQVEGRFVSPGEEGPIAIEDGVEVFVGKFPLKISDDRRSFSGPLSLPDGDHKLLIAATDLAGNRHEKMIEVRVGVVPLEVYLSPKPSLIKKEGMVAMLLFEGKTVPEALVLFGNRPVEVGKDGIFKFAIYPHELREMYSLGHTTVIVQDRLGRSVEIDIPQEGDYVLPYWEFLQIVERSKGTISLKGKVSKADVRVEIGSVEGISDHAGVVTIDNVSIGKGQTLVSTILRDSFGNESHIDRWIQ